MYDAIFIIVLVYFKNPRVRKNNRLYLKRRSFRSENVVIAHALVYIITRNV